MVPHFLYTCSYYIFNVFWWVFAYFPLSSNWAPNLQSLLLFEIHSSSLFLSHAESTVKFLSKFLPIKTILLPRRCSFVLVRNFFFFLDFHLRILMCLHCTGVFMCVCVYNLSSRWIRLALVLFLICYYFFFNTNLRTHPNSCNPLRHKRPPPSHLHSVCFLCFLSS